MTATALSSSMMAVLVPTAAFAQNAPVFNWTGFYLGGGVGAHFSDEPGHLDLPETSSFDVDFVDGTPIFFNQDPSAFMPWPTQFDLDDVSGAVGVLTGYNYQIGRMVLGLEADWFWLGQEAKDRWSRTEEFSNQALQIRRTDLAVFGGVDWLSTLRARIGVAATERLLFFGTGGLAIGDASIGSTADIIEQYADGGKSAAWAGEESETMVGFAAGGGAEYALNDNATFRFEGLYYDLGRLSATVTGTGLNTRVEPGDILTVQPYRVERDMEGVIGRAAFTYRF
jgi:outer membrane immunogenic protein